ncbi:MAG: hypothetical protein IV100_03510 [Myxococcales bacterium]|nr:hypothetical protein [Myxococcales bacterium]
MNKSRIHSPRRPTFGRCTFSAALASSLLVGCLSEEPAGIGASPAAAVTVKFDFFHRPLPELPLPNDVATRVDASSPTGRRINASMIAATRYEVRTRELIDQLDGWGVFMPITVPFTGPVDIESITSAHPPDDFAFGDDVIYLVDVDPKSPTFGEFQHLDVGGGNYPVVLEELERYWDNDPRSVTNSLVFEEVDEDKNGNGKLDSGEDTDADGLLDKPNYLPGSTPAADDLAGRADALMTFWERETNTLIVRPMVPLRQRTTYAVVITRRLKDEKGQPVGSPFPFKNHEMQTDALAPLAGVLSKQGQSLDDVAFAFTFTTQTIESSWLAVRDGLYGLGVQKHIGEQFPAELGGVEPLLDIRDGTPFAGRKSPFIMHHEDWSGALSLIASQFLNAKPGSALLEKLEMGHKYIDYHIVGWYDAPQLFERWHPDGTLRPLNDQSWPADLDTKPAPVRGERVYFHLVVPRKEVSARGEGKPAPLVILGHGYGGNRFDAVSMGGFFARHGMAVLAIDDVSHGIDISDDEFEQASGILGMFGLSPALEAMVRKHRAIDQNGDGKVDSGVDFWTAYLFHTRDVVRQSALDYMQAVRILRSFDGKRKWHLDVNGDGKEELAGDFDGDGKIDVGGDASLNMFGASLGGIMSSIVGAVEPELDSVVPIAAGGGLGDVALRSIQGGVPEAVILRMLGPIFMGSSEAGSDTVSVQTLIPDVNKEKQITLGSVPGVKAGDFIVVENHSIGTRACAFVWDDAGVLRWRTGLEANVEDKVAVHFYEGDAMLLGSTECAVQAGKTPRVTFDSFGGNGSFQDRHWKVGTPLVALAEGLGLPRASPRIRRFLGLAQLVLDACDPAAMVPFMQERPLTFGDGSKTKTNMLIVTTAGDMNVPASTGTSIARAAGLVNYTEKHPTYGKSLNQVLIDTFTVEAVHNLKRFTDPAGNGVIMDIENFSGGTDLWGTDVPRLDPPLRLGFDANDALKTPVRDDSGISAAIFPFPVPEGQHGFEVPGGLIDRFRDNCKAACASGEDCKCDAIVADDKHFDVGAYMFNLMAHYVTTGGKSLADDACLSRDDCDFIAPVPETRTFE